MNALKDRWLGRVAARVALERLAGGFEGFEGFEGGQTAGLNAFKNRWLGRVDARVALERLARGFEGFEGLGRVAARVALERLAEGFEAFEGGQTAGLNARKRQMAGACSCESCLGKACGKVRSWELPRRV